MDNTHESVDSATTEDQGPLNRQDLTDRSPGDSSGTTPEHLVLPGEPELEAAAVALHDLTGAQPELLGPAPAARKPHPAAAVQPDAEIGPT